jgi:hypothetical protein
MITQRFRPVGWVAGVATAATILYLISLQVASERGRLEQIDRKIAMAKHDIRQLQTELGTRASLRQLERWNGDVLALSAPQAKQFLGSEAALATVDRGELGDAAAPPIAVMVSADVPSQTSVDATENQAGMPVLAPAPATLSKQDRALQQAITPKKPKADRVAALDGALADRVSANGAKAKEKARP